MPYRIYEQLGRDDIMKEDRNITMINYTEAEVTDRLVNVLCQVGFTTQSAKFLILEIPVDRDAPIVQPNQKKIKIAESDSDDEEDYVIKMNDMGTRIHNSRPIGYQNNTNPAKNITFIDSKVSGQGKSDLTNLDEQVDLFFYKEPEDAKEPEDELAVADYKDYGAGNLRMKDWSANITNAQWSNEVGNTNFRCTYCWR
ncbi:hypothetical protein Tco_0611632 [Tanacetum coccineum]